MTRTLVPWNVPTPRLFENLRQEMNQLMDQFFGGDFVDRGNGRESLIAFAPRLNIAETEKEYEVSLDLPGMKPEEFSVEFKDGHLWISGERKQEKEEKGKTYHRVERQYGQFRRVIPLGTAVNPDKVQAEYKDGVLRITVPKDEASQPKRIPVKS